MIFCPISFTISANTNVLKQYINTSKYATTNNLVQYFMEFYFNQDEYYFSLIDTYTVMASDNQSWARSRVWQS